MNARSKLERLERAVAGRSMSFICPECGWTVRDLGDLPLKVIVADWQDETGHERPLDPILEQVLSHPHEELLEEVLRGVGARLAPAAG